MTNHRIEAAVGAVQEAFWTEIAKRFPEIRDGTVSMNTKAVLGVTCELAVRFWLESKLP